MPWYGWIAWILLILVSCAFALFLVLRKPKSPQELRDKLKRVEADYRTLKAQLAREKIARKKAEDEKAQVMLKALEETYSRKLASLSKEERKEYERLKADPDSGVDFVREWLDSKGTGSTEEG